MQNEWFQILLNEQGNCMHDIEVIYATEDDQLIIKVKVSAGSTIEQAIKASAVLVKYPEIDLLINNVGVFNQKKKCLFSLS